MNNYFLIKKLFSCEDISLLLDKANNKKEFNSKVGVGVGLHVNKKKKIRKDIFFSQTESKEMDKIYFNKIQKIVREKFNLMLKYRETYKIGTYYGDEKGFYVPHTDTQGGYQHRKISVVICLSKIDEYEGGIFKFINLKKNFKFNVGDTIIFKSNILHGVEPITSGKRQVLVSFMWDEEGEQIRQKKYPKINNSRYLANNISVLGHHDIDYSGLYLSHKYTDSDCYLYEKNDSDILFVTFSGLGCKNTVPTFIFHNFFKKYDTIDKLFLRDIKRKYYLTGLKHNTNNINETIQFIQNIIKIKKYKKIVGIGCSAGGFAAILYGNLLKFDKIIAFAPQVVLNNDKIEIIKDNIIAPKTCKFLTNYSKDPFFQKCLNLKSFIPFIPEVEIHFPELASNGIDKRHAEYIQHNKCKIIGYESKNHRIALELRDKGILQKIIDNEIS